MKNTPYCGLGILTHGTLNFNKFFNFSKFSNRIERKLFQLHFFSLNEIPKVVIFKVTMRGYQVTSTFWHTFWMPGP